MSKKYWAIDLGTTNSAIAYSTNNVTELITFPNGQKQLPSVVYKMGNAQPQAIPERSKSLFSVSQINPDDHIFESWKLLLADERGNRGVPSHKSIIVDDKITPVVLSSIILKRIIENAERTTGEAIEDLCVSIPANFNEVARMNTVKAIKLASPKIKNIKLVHEPTAAAISTLEIASKSSLANKTFVVIDIGGGTTDISIVRFIVDGNEMDIEVKGSDGENIAGKSFDEKILQNMIRPAISQRLRENGTLTNIRDVIKDNNGLLMYLAEQMKLKFSKEQDDITEVIKIDIDGKEEKITIDAKYEEFLKEIEPMFEHILNKLDNLIRKLKLTEFDIEKIILAGSSSAGPWVKKFIIKRWGKDKVTHNPSFEGAIAKGASIVSGINFNKGVFQYKNDSLSIEEVVSHYIGIQVNLTGVRYFINKNEPLPVRKIQNDLYKLSSEDFEVRLVESTNGSPFYRDTTVIGKILLKDLPEGLINVEFIYNDQNKLIVNITDSRGIRHNDLQITYDKNLERFDHDELSQIKELEKEIRHSEARQLFQTSKQMQHTLETFLQEKRVPQEAKEFILSEIKKEPTKLNKYLMDIKMR